MMKKQYVVRKGKLDSNRIVWFVDDSRIDMWVDFWDTEIEAQTFADRRNAGVCVTCGGTRMTGETDGGFTPCPECDHLYTDNSVDDLDDIPF